MDAIDLKLVETLQREGRATQLELGKTVGLSQPAVAERMRKLEDRGVIKGYVARVDPSKLGLDVMAFVRVGLEHPRFFDAFDKKIKGISEVMECHRVTGEDSYLLKIRSHNTRTLDHLLIKVIRAIPGVTSTNTTIVLAPIKEETVVPSAIDLLEDA